MDLKTRLQRVLQIVEEAERVGSLSELERDIALSELREAYAELKFGTTENEKQKTENEEQSEIAPTTPIIPIAPTTPIEKVEPEVDVEEEGEPEVEVELIFDESESEETENGERKTENEQEQEQENEQNAKCKMQNAECRVDNSQFFPRTPNASNASNDLNAPIVEEKLSTSKRSPLLSLYEESAPIIGEQFHEAPSVADTIACPKGMAESAPIVSLHDAIGVADKFMLIRELFDDDVASYESAIEALDKQPSFDDCIIFIAEHYAWSPNLQATKLVMDLLQRKYN